MKRARPPESEQQYSSEEEEQESRIGWAPSSEKRQLLMRLDKEFQEKRQAEKELDKLRQKTGIKWVEMFKDVRQPKISRRNQQQEEVIEEIDDESEEELQHFPAIQQQQQQQQQQLQSPIQNQVCRTPISKILMSKTDKDKSIPTIHQMTTELVKEHQNTSTNIFLRDKNSDKQSPVDTSSCNKRLDLTSVYKEAIRSGSDAILGGWSKKRSRSGVGVSAGLQARLNQVLKTQKQIQDQFDNTGFTNSNEQPLKVKIVGRTYEGPLMKYRAETDEGKQCFVILKSKTLQKESVEVGNCIQIVPPWQDVVLGDGDKVILASFIKQA